ncbi:MAG: site-2 protease family protein [Firmicutes bacterium]|nr:site-2 protease family protein [Bacillota bacterium]
MFFLFILLAIVILLLMILIHEVGHYVAGKIFKFKIKEFSIGFGPKLFQKKRKNGEKFTLRMLPLGGYCAFYGDDEGAERLVRGSDKPEDGEAPAEEAEADKATGNERGFNDEKPWKRIIVFAAGATFNIVSAVLFSFIFILAAGTAVPKVLSVSGDPANIDPVTGKPLSYNAQLLEGDRIIAIEGHKITVMRSYEDIIAKLNPQPGDSVAFTVLRDGKKTEIKVERKEFLRTVYSGFGFDYSVEKDGPTVRWVVKDTDEENTPYNDLMPGDVITAVNGTAVDSGKNTLQSLLQAVEGTASLTIKRDGAELSAPVTLGRQWIKSTTEAFGFSHAVDAGAVIVTRVETQLDGTPYNDLKPGDVIVMVGDKTVGRDGTVAELLKDCKVGDTVLFSVKRVVKEGEVTVEKLLPIPLTKQVVLTSYTGFGFTRGQGSRVSTFGEALAYSIPFTGKMSWAILGAFGGLFTGQVALTDMSGPVGTVAQMAEVSQSDWRNILILLPLLAANLAIFNLLPFPALDGAHIVFTGIEWVRRKPVNRNVETWIHLVGMGLLILFVVFVDIFGFIGRGAGPAGGGWLRL